MPQHLRHSHCPGTLSIGLGEWLFLNLGGILFLSLLALLLDLLQLLNLLVEAAGGDLVQAEDVLVGVLDKDELGVLRVGLEAHVGNGADDTPAVGEREVHLVGEILGLPANNAENNVLVVDLGVDAGDETVEEKIVS